MNILIVVNDIDSTINFKKLFESIDCCFLGFAQSIEDIDILSATNKIDIIIIDINFRSNDKTCIDIASLLELPILYLMDSNNQTIIEQSIKTNPLASILKPINENELKINILLSKYKLSKEDKKTDPNHIKIGHGYYCDKTIEELFYHDILIPLGRNEKKLLKLLLNNKGTIVSNKTIEEEVWGSKIVSDNTRRNLIYRLRTKLEYKFIETIHEVGCRLLVQE